MHACNLVLFVHIPNLQMHAETSPQDDEMTPHPFNLLVPMEINTPTAFAIDPQDFAGTLAHHFYGRPSERMTTVGVTGTNGKTTVAWLMRSVFEQMGKLTGMIGTIEYALATDRLDLDGDFWESVDIDTTLNRECSAPFWAAPYEGKYHVPCTTPDNVSVRPRLIFSLPNCLHQSIYYSTLCCCAFSASLACVRFLSLLL
jgi:hypothetical protein